MALFCASVLGLLIGSFLNVVIYRLPKALIASWEKSSVLDTDVHSGHSRSLYSCLLTPPSTTPCCNMPIKWFDNIPVISWLWLRGKCRYCSHAIAIRYVLVELLVALSFYWAVWHFDVSWTSALYAVFFCLTISLFWIDLGHYLLPDSLTLSLLWAGLIGSAVGVLPVNATDAIIGAALGYLVLFVFNTLYRLVRHKDGFGGGDLKLLSALGAWLGWTAVMPTLFIAAITGLVCVVIGMIFKRQIHSLNHSIPFGPFLIFSGVILLVCRAENLQLPFIQ